MGPDMSPLVAGVDFVTIISAVINIAALAAVYFLVLGGSQGIIDMVRRIVGEPDHYGESDFEKSIDGDFCFRDQKGVTWDKNFMGRWD